MQSELIYVELKSGCNDDGPAWIGRGTHSRSYRSIYFNGMCLKRGARGEFANHTNIETGDEYWVSGVKKNQQDRHWAGSGMIMIDDAVVEEYLVHVGLSQLDPATFTVITFELNDAVRERVHELENRPLT